ncbi:hypothetical protein SY88_23795 [Clostridiales bacterium PH28_bin88]|nr:hypothetical protein SY88_23795 [Clostridiales bacterium PH28_bin88]
MEYMIWFDNNNLKPLERRIMEGAAYFERKHGRRANICLVNPGDLVINPSPGPSPSQAMERGDIRLIADRRVMKNYFWLGEEINQDAI